MTCHPYSRAFLSRRRCPAWRLLSAIAFILLAVLIAKPCSAVELGLNVHDSFLWAEGSVLSADSGLVVIGSPNGLRFYRELKTGAFVLIGEYEVPSGVRDCLLRDSTVYFADNLGVASALDISDPSQPEHQGDFGPPEPVVALALNDDYLISAGSGKAVSYNLDDARHPSPTGEWLYAGATVDVTAQDSLILIMQGLDGILAGVLHPDGSITGAGQYRISTPAPGFPINEAATDGRYAWVPHGTDGVLVIDFADPFHPVSASQIVTFGRVEHVSLAGDRLLVADAIIGLISYRLLIPEVPYWQFELSAMRNTKALWSETGARFYAKEGNDMFALRVGPLGDLTVGEHIGQPGGYGRLVRYGDLALLPDDSGMWRFDGFLANADSAFGRVINGHPVYGAMLYNNRLHSAEGRFGAVTSYIDPQGNLSPFRFIRPEQVSSTDVCIAHDTLIVIENGEGFQIYDVSGTHGATFLGRYRWEVGYAAAAFPTSRYFYLSESNGPVNIYDIRFPSKPSRVGFLPGILSAQQLTIEGKRLYVAVPSQGVSVYDITNPRSPAPLYQYPEPAAATAFYRSGRTLYTGDANGRITAVDIANPSNTPVIATANVVGSIKSIQKFRERLWVTTDAAVYAVDVIPPLALGDFNADGFTDSIDMAALIDYLFAHGPPPYRPNVSDMNGDGESNLIDLVRLISYIFGNGTPLDQGIIE